MADEPDAAAAADLAAKRRAHRLETSAREQRTHQPLLDSVTQTAGLPKTWMRVLKATGPIVGTAASGLVAAFHPESPGGRKATKGELEAIAKTAARDLEAALLREFKGDLD